MPLVGKLSNIPVKTWPAFVIIFLILFCLHIVPAENASAAACSASWDIWVTGGMKTNYQSGETISGNVNFKLNNPAICPRCTRQILVGIIDAQNKVIDVKCIYDGIPKVCPQWTRSTASFSLMTPTIPGNYKIIAANYYQHSCSDAVRKYFPSQIGSQAPLVEYKLIATITISAASSPPPPPPPGQPELELPPLPNPFEDAVPKMQNSIAQMEQTIGSIVQNVIEQIKRIVKTIVLPLAVVVLIAAVVWKKRWQIRDLIKGLIVGNDGGTCVEKYTWFPASVKDKQILLIRDWIVSFNPRKDYDLEAPYHDELFSCLKSKDRQARSNPRRGSTMPDIAVGKVAIEVKGPTRNRDLDTIPTKSWRYLGGGGYSFLFIVLFKPKFSEKHFYDLIQELKHHYPSRAAVITKKRNKF